MSLILLTLSAHLFCFLIVHFLICTQNYLNFSTSLGFHYLHEDEGWMECKTHFLSSISFSFIHFWISIKSFRHIEELHESRLKIRTHEHKKHINEILKSRTTASAAYKIEKSSPFLIRDYYFVVDFIHTVRIKFIRTHSIFVLWRGRKRDDVHAGTGTQTEFISLTQSLNDASGEGVRKV